MSKVMSCLNDSDDPVIDGSGETLTAVVFILDLRRLSVRGSNMIIRLNLFAESAR